jgi:hypothetical protein
MNTIRRAGGAAVVAAVLVLAAASSASAAGTVTVAVTGQGSATGTGINCNQSGGPDCSETYANGSHQECDSSLKPPCHTVVDFPFETFTAGPDSNGFVFDGWSGCDSVSNRVCSLEVTADTVLVAAFRDAQAPTVPTPSPGSGVQRGTITLSTAPTDNSGTINRVEFRVRGVLVATDTTAPYSASFNTASIADGTAVIRATAFDAAGNASFAESTVKIDNTAPAISVTSGPDGQTFGPGSTQTWAFTASDATSGVAAVECSLVPAASADSFGACSGGTSSHSVTGEPGGAYRFMVRVRDNGGLVTTAPARTFTIDATPPETTITSGPADGSSGTDTTATFGFASSEGGSTFACRVYPAALTPPAFAPCSGATSHTASGFAPGTYSFEVRATDAYGNADATPAKRTFTVASPSAEPPSSGSSGDGGGAPAPPPSGDTSPPAAGATPVTPLAPAFLPRVSSATKRSGAMTTFTKLTVSGLPSGAKVQISCKGKGCAFRTRSLTVKGATLNVLRALKRLRLGSGAVLTVRVTNAAGTTRATALKMRRGARPQSSTRCAPPGGALGGC